MAVTIQEAINLGVQQHRAGNLAEAERIYRQVLAEQPNQADALHLLGVLAGQAGQHQASVELIGRALRQQPRRADFYGSLGVTLAAMGKIAEAADAYRKSISLDGKSAAAYAGLGTLLAQQGQTKKAIECLQQAIQLDPNGADHYFNLGNVVLGMGRLDEAISLFDVAVKADRHSRPEYHNNLGIAHRQKGNLELAIAWYGHAVSLKPDYVDALSNLGEALWQKGENEKAIGFCRRALMLRPEFPEGLVNLGGALAGAERWEEAINAFRAAIMIRPAYPQAHDNLGCALMRQGDARQAVECHRTALQLRPDFVDAYNNLAAALLELGSPAEAEAACRQALGLQPDFAEAQANLGNAIYRQGRLEESAAALGRAIEMGAECAEAHLTLGNVYMAQGRDEEAAGEYTRAAALRPTDAAAHVNLGLSLLMQGDYERGWAEYEWRWRRPREAGRENFAAPMWDGSQLEGRRILLHAEDGIADAIQFARFVPRVARSGGRIIIACQPELQRLLQATWPASSETGGKIEQWTARGEAPGSHDVQSPLMRLAHVFQTRVENISADVPYLSADSAEAARWRERVRESGGRINVGVAWADEPEQARLGERPVTLEQLAPLAKVAHAALFSLQKGAAARQAGTAGIKLIDWTKELKDIADMAALIENLDLVISVDGAAAHLAGALGKPVWILLPWAADWRWMRRRVDSAWYPTARLFRQPAAGDWAGPIGQVVTALEEL